ncbi:uncharacterized protein Dvar_66700 [Desulfosarcina variabilis str. Montpellier]
MIEIALTMATPDRLCFPICLLFFAVLADEWNNCGQDQGNVFSKSLPRIPDGFWKILFNQIPHHFKW